MTRSRTPKVPPFSADHPFPYVLLCSTFGTIVSVASVWLATSLTFAPTIGA